MTYTEIQKQLLELAKEFKNDEVDLEDAEILERSALKMIAEFIFSNQLHQGVYTEDILPEQPSQWSSDRLSYFIDFISLKDDTIFDLNWMYKSTFWSEEYESKEHYIVLLREMIENKEIFYDLEEDF
jgi:hypothetical protein